MTPVSLDTKSLNSILSLQLLVAWAGEGLSEPKRLDWWRTDLIDPEGGGDLLGRLLPRTARWASLEAVRYAAVSLDKKARMGLAQPDKVRTLFFWGFSVDEQLSEQLSFYKRNGADPAEALSFPVDLGQPFDRSHFEDSIRDCASLLGGSPDYKVVPGGREIQIKGDDSLDAVVKRLAAALLPLSEKYPMPFYRVEGG